MTGIVDKVIAFNPRTLKARTECGFDFSSTVFYAGRFNRFPCVGELVEIIIRNAKVTAVIAQAQPATVPYKQSRAGEKHYAMGVLLRALEEAETWSDMMHVIRAIEKLQREDAKLQDESDLYRFRHGATVGATT